MESHVENRVENVLSTARGRQGEEGKPAKNQLGYCVGSDRDSEGVASRGSGGYKLHSLLHFTKL